jgi:hypothetical protein
MNTATKPQAASDPDAAYFREQDQIDMGAPLGVILAGSVPAWTCECRHVNGLKVEACNNCGSPRYLNVTADDYIRAYKQICDGIMERTIAELEAIDRKHGVGPYDYSGLRRKSEPCPVHLKNPAASFQEVAA